MDIFFVTSNPNKIKEVKGILPKEFNVLGLEDLGHKTEIPETQETIEGNSLQKAQFIWDHYGKACFAEDTGLVVPILNGEPGIYSARYAGPQKSAEDNMDKLLENLQDKNDRSAYFKTVVTWIAEGKAKQFTGILEGQIGFSKTGEGGFGYDPIFLLENGKSLAEIGSVEKNKISHRAKAIEQLIAFLKANYG